MGYRVSYRMLLNTKSIFSKTAVRSYRNNLFALKTFHRTLSICERNPKFTTSSFSISAEVAEDFFYKHGFKGKKLINELNYNSYDKETVNYHTRLYPRIQVDDDPLLEALVKASTIEQVFGLIKEQPLNVKYASQAIATLWNLKKGYYNVTSNTESKNKDFIQVVKSHPQFWIAVDCVAKSASLLSDDTLTSMLLYLRKFQISMMEPSLQSLLCTALTRVKTFSLDSLAKWCLFTSTPNHGGRLMLPAALPAFHRHVNHCQSLTDLEMLSVCFVAIAPVVDKNGPTARIFIDHIIHLLDTNVLNQDTPLAALVGVLRALYQVAKSNPLSSCASVRILYLLQDSHLINNPSSMVYFDAIRRSWEAVNEPIGLVRKLENIVCSWLEKLDIQIEHINLLSHVSHIQDASSDRKKQLERHLMRILEKEQPIAIEPYLKQIFRIIRSSKMSDIKLVDLYWNRVLQSLARRLGNKEEFVALLLDAAQWYMFFNNNLGGTYRSSNFENEILKWMDGMMNGDWSQPVQNVRFFCRLAAFVLAYGGHPTATGLLEKLVDIEEQLTIQDIFYISRGIQLARHWLRRPQLHFSQRDTGDLTLMLDRRSAFLLSSPASSTLSLTTTILHAALYRNAESYGSALPLNEAGLRECETRLNELTARVIRDLIFFLDRFRYLQFPIMDAIVDYALKKHEHLGPSLLVNIFVLCFNLGYSSKNLELLAPITSQSLESKENGMFGLFVLEASLALILSNRLSIKLVNEIFTVQFLDKLDLEVAACYSKATYPARVRRTLMELNRSVCIDMPEAGVPWFHEKYCQEQIHTNPPTSTNFHVDIHHCLVQILGNSNLIERWTYSPYYHLIDFEVHLNENGQPVVPSANKSKMSNDREEKIAILALLPSLFTTNYGYLMGLSLLRQRQLEILGYRVVGIPHHHWNSLALSTTQAKSNYLKQKLFRQHNV
ncbi:putative FAST kinase domain-containing protein 1 [Daphnia magna]|uniref:Putative FAST kinase domain-containing protein 1 n=1 Tax=Daphnia magna TaxID=35525 RepID=A0A0P5XBE9_9CRUS|nr:putative FAST kinase domain-containing protein 1 [Daphnia magna]